MNTPVKIIAAIAILIFVPLIIQKIMPGDSEPDTNRLMTDMANQANKDMPKKVDSDTIATKVEFDAATRTYRVHYTMNPGLSIDPGKKAEYTAVAVRQICNSEMRIILEKKVTMEYLYTYSANGGPDQQMTISLPPKSCQ